MVQLTAAQVFRDYVTEGTPSSGPNKVKKSEVRTWGGWIETILGSLGAAGGYVFSNIATMNANLTPPANAMAWVVGDAVVANNGVYVKQGSSGTGFWTRVMDLPLSFIQANNIGAGTANAIRATTSVPVSQSALILLPIVETNTGSPITVSFNDGEPLTIKANLGSDVTPNGLPAGSLVLGTIHGGIFRLANDESIASLILAAKNEAEGFASAAAASSVVASEFADDSAAARDQSQIYSNNAAESASEAALLVAAAEAGFAGFPSTAAYDFGSIADPATYFNQDWGTL